MKKSILIFVAIISFFSFSKSFAEDIATTFVLSNEGGLIDDLIRAGNGDKNLYQTLEILKPKSGGVISDEFMATLANCPAGSEIFTAALSNFAGLNNPVCVNTDGTLGIRTIFGKDYFTSDGYTTLPLNQKGYTSELFTVANSAENYIDAGAMSLEKRYKAFAIAWKASTTFVLTNEGGLIDDLIRAGHGDKNLYQTLEILKPKSGGVISDEFMATLANCPAGSEIFTAALSNFSVNYPVCINSEGTIAINPIYGRDYFNRLGYSTNSENQEGYTSQLFTYPISSEYYINAGVFESDSVRTTYYNAFAIAWKASTTFVLSNEGGLIDDLIRAGHGDKNLYQTLEILKPKSGGVISDEFMATLANCPAGSEIFSTQLNNYTGLNNPVCINTDGTCNILGIFGKDYYQKTGYYTWPEQSSSQTELFTVSNDFNSLIEAGFLEPNYYYKAFAIAWSKSIKYDTTKTIILSNEMGSQNFGGLLDMLVSEGYGNSSLFDVLQLLQPHSQEVINTEFMNHLAESNNKDVFESHLQNFADTSNNPIGVGENGMLIVTPIYGRDLMGKSGFNTISYNRNATIKEMFTYATSPEYYIDAGVRTIDDTTTLFKAYAVIWLDTITTGINDNPVETRELIIFPNPASEYIEIRSPSNKRGSGGVSEEIKIYNTFGDNVVNYELRITNYENTIIDISHLPVGIYFIQIGNYSEKFIVVR